MTPATITFVLLVELPTRGVAVERLLADHDTRSLPEAVEAELAAILEYAGFTDARITLEVTRGE